MKEALARLRAAWAARTPRERQVLSFGGIVLLVLLAWAGVWTPVKELHQRRVADLAAARDIAVQLEMLAAEGAGGAREKGPASNRSLLSVVDQSSKRSRIGKAPTRIQPDGDAEVRVWFEDVSFDNLLRWLSDLSTRDGVEVSEANFERQSGSGLVNARVTLVRP